MSILALRPFTRRLHDLSKEVFCYVTDLHTNRQTDRHCNSMTKLAQWVDSEKIILYIFWKDIITNLVNYSERCF